MINKGKYPFWQEIGGIATLIAVPIGISQLFKVPVATVALFAILLILSRGIETISRKLEDLEELEQLKRFEVQKAQQV